MKIGIDCRLYSSNLTGIGRYTAELVANFIKLNNTLATPNHLILFFNEPDYDAFQTKDPNVEKIKVNIRHYSLSEQTRFLKILNSHNLDLMYFPHFNVPLFYKKPFVVTIHDLTLSHFKGQKMTGIHHRIGYNLVIRGALNKAKKIIAVSKYTKNDIIKTYKIPSQKIEVVYNGVSKNFSKQLNKSELKKSLEKFNIKGDYLLYTGVWRSHKNLPRLIKAFNILLNRKLPLSLVITGKDDPHYPEVKNTVSSLKLSDRVIFTGLTNESDLRNLYSGAKIYVYPSLHEGFGLPPLEAMACQTPVVASNASSIPEICGKNNALFFNPNDEKVMAEKIERLYLNDKLKKELIKNGLRHIKNFSWEESFSKIFKLCLNLLKNS